MANDSNFFQLINTYNLRYSQKAKRLQIKISAKGVEVIVPIRTKIKTEIIEQFLNEKSDWIKKNQAKYTLDIERAESEDLLPNLIYFTSLEQTWNIHYIHTVQQPTRWIENAERTLSIVGDIKNQLACIATLCDWLKQLAKNHFTLELNQLAASANLKFRQLTIRSNSTRWGSCSTKGNINLDCKLLFLPQNLVRHVMLHELCHTKFMHHGKSFWDLLQQVDPDTATHVKLLKQAMRYIPKWAK